MQNCSNSVVLLAAICSSLLCGCQTAKVPADVAGAMTRETAEWGRIPIGDRYVLLNNVWNKGAAHGSYYQDVFKGTADGRDFLGWSWNWLSNGKTVVSYPEVYCGSTPWDPEHGTAPEFPFRIGSNKVSATFDIDIKATGKYDMAFDLWTLSTLPNTRENLTHEIMIWNVDKTGSNWTWAKNLGSPVIDGTTFDVYKDPNHVDVTGASPIRWTAIIFIARKSVLKATWDLDEFLDFLVEKGELSTNHYLCNVELGVETYYGNGVVKIFDYSVDVQSLP
jgi:hypothetical protein